MARTILITGASSGIGRALALEYTQNKENILFLSGRNKKELEKTAKSCKKEGLKVFTKILDVRDKIKTKKWIEEIGEKFKLDIIIANAGISAGTAGGIENEKQIADIFDTNVNGVLNIINPAIKIMEKQKYGQIALMSSLAGLRGLPSSPAYSASKAAVRVYGEGLRGSLSSLGIKVSVICPGYIKTPMTDVNKFPMPFLMKAEKAAKIIKRGLGKNKSRIAFPFPLYFIVWLMSLISTKITDPIFAKLPKKSAFQEN
jgi:short-subunit dehydrogenase